MRESLIKGGIPVLAATVLLILLQSTTQLSRPVRVLDITTANLIADVFIICIAFYSRIVPKESSLCKWYTKYGLSAVLADTLIGVIYMLIAFEICNSIGKQPPAGLTPRSLNNSICFCASICLSAAYFSRILLSSG